MKTKFIQLLIVLSVLTNNLKSQITLDQIVTPKCGIGCDFYTVQISKNETKYLFEDTLTQSFSLYNMDFSPFLTNISVPHSFSQYGYQVIYVSRSLFDCDSTNIEYVYQKAVDGYATFYIMRTDGTQLFKLDSANGPYCLGSCLGLSDIIEPIKNTSAGAKLFLQRPNGKIHIYSLCGTFTSGESGLHKRVQTIVKVFPNPTNNTLTFELNPPDNMNEYQLLIFDNNGQEIKREKPKGNKHSIDVSQFSNGLYFYSLHSDNKILQSGKFVLTK